MRGVHDMGGVPGFDAVLVEDNEPIFHEEWERRVFGMMTTAGHRRFPMRPAIESIEPETYIASGYYEKWLLALERGLVESGDLTAEELRKRAVHYDRNPNGGVSENRDSESCQSSWQSRYSQRSPKYNGTRLFSVGDQVVTRQIDRSGHTRLPHYAQGKLGVICDVRGVYDLLDLKVQGVLKPEPVYVVSFDAQELWGDDAESNQSVYVDVWESYLVPSPSVG